MLGIGFGIGRSSSVGNVLDGLNISAAWSLRKLRSGVPSAIRVRRGSDNAEMDIGFVGNRLDTTSLLSFVCKTGNLSNLIGTYGNFGTDSNADGLGDGWGLSGTLSSKSMANNVQSFTGVDNISGIGIPKTVAPGHKLYACGWLKNNAGTGIVRLQLRTGASAYPTSSIVTSTSFTFTSLLATVEADYTSGYIWVKSEVSAEAKQIHFFDLTAIFGSGNEPSKAEMDSFMQAQSAYINTASATVGNGYIRTLYDQWKNGCDAVQTSADYQPMIVIGGSLNVDSNGNPTILFPIASTWISVVNNATLDFLNAPLFVNAVFSANTRTGYVFSRNLDTFSNNQYAISWDYIAKKAQFYAENLVRQNTADNSITDNTQVIYSQSFIAGNQKGFVNGVNSGVDGNYFAGTMTSKPWLTIGARANNAVGTAYAGNLSGNISEIIIGTDVTIRSKIEASQKKYYNIA